MRFLSLLGVSFWTEIMFMISLLSIQIGIAFMIFLENWRIFYWYLWFYLMDSTNSPSYYDPTFWTQPQHHLVSCQKLVKSVIIFYFCSPNNNFPVASIIPCILHGYLPDQVILLASTHQFVSRKNLPQLLPLTSLLLPN